MKLLNKRINIIFGTSLLVMIIWVIIMMFFLNRFLFFIHGFTWESMDLATVEKAKAYKAIYPTKVFMIFAGFIASIVMLFYSRKLRMNGSKKLYQFTSGICWIIFIIFLTFVIFYFIVPKGPMI